jgi:ribosomal-protein-alanine N-acetyltransferase
MIIVETERLLLKRFCLADADAMNGIFGDPQVMRYGEGVQSPQWIHDWLRDCLQTYQLGRGIGPWAVVEKDKKSTIGYCGLFYYPDVNGQPETEIGYRLARAWWGMGYATEAVTAVRDYGFNTLGIPRLIAMIDPQNLASVRVAIKAGMHYEKDVMFEGYTHPDHLYAISGAVAG